MGHEKDSLLGKATHYAQHYDPSLLFPLTRQDKRAALGLSERLPFIGEDVWTAFELSWLQASGKPEVAVAEFRLPHNSPMMIESKSFKLYLNSLNQTQFASRDALHTTLVRDLSAAAQAEVGVRLLSPRPDSLPLVDLAAEARCLDNVDASDFVYEPAPGLLTLKPGEALVSERLYSDLLRSNCPVTGQPDWGSVVIDYTGPAICHTSLLKYIVSFRQCQDFHEHCVERMFCDLLAQCKPETLSVYARYTRRGGLDINPYRATPGCASTAPAGRTVRQ